MELVLNSNFEIRYLDVAWYDKETVLTVKESYAPLKVEYSAEHGYFIANTVIYQKSPDILHGQLGFRLLNDIYTEPYFKNGDLIIPLKKIYDKDTGKTWWIESDKWLKDKKRWAPRTYRTAGNVTVVIDKQICIININISEDTSDQLKKYLSDFKNDIWELILDDKSYVTGEINKSNDGGVNEETTILIKNLITHAQNITKNIKSELREIQSSKSIRQVKPVNRTFMEIAVKGYAKKLTSRGVKANYNIPDNKYILFALKRIAKIIKMLTIVSASRISRYQNAKLKLQDRLDLLSNHTVISKDLVLKDLRRLRSLYDPKIVNEKLKSKINTFNVENDAFHKTIHVRVKSPSSKTDINNPSSFFVEHWIDQERCWSGSHDGKYIFLNINNKYSNLIKSNFDYEIIGDISILTRNNNLIYNINTISSIRVIGGVAIDRGIKKFNEIRQSLSILEQNEWKRQLNHQEIEEQSRERLAINNRILYYSENLNKVKLVYAALEPKVAKLNGIINLLCKMGITASDSFPNSMTFVQNPDYQSIHTIYKKIRNLTNLTDEGLLLELEKIDEIGLINMPILYERWCLLQIIKVITQNYHYIPKNDWRRNLISILSSNYLAQRIDFVNDNVNRSIQLYYELVLDNGKRPDFVLDVTYDTKEGYRNTKRLVIDAKYYSTDIIKSFGGISGLIDHLYNFKDYSEGGKNSVFIIHPTVTGLDNIVSPQSWGKHSYLGEIATCIWDEEPRSKPHCYGAICANPSMGVTFLDEFQRLLGMFLQYGIENNVYFRNSDDVESVNFCIACGSANLSEVAKSNTNSKSHWYKCNECQHFTIYNHCRSCGTRIIKNGTYWTYHSIMPLEPLNIKCPSCESLL